MCKKYRLDTKRVFVAPRCGDVLGVVFHALPSFKYFQVSGHHLLAQAKGILRALKTILQQI